MSRNIGEITDEMRAVSDRVEALTAQSRTADGDVELAGLHARFKTLDAEARAAEVADRIAEFDRPRPRKTDSPMGSLLRPGSWSGVPVAGATSTTLPPQLAIGTDPETVKAVASYVRTGARSFGAQAAMTIGSPPDGGNEVLPYVDRDLVTVSSNQSPLYRLAKQVDGATDGYRANVATTLPASAWKAEGDTRSVTNSPTIAQIVPQRGAVAAVVQASQWLMQDADHDLYAFLVTELGRQFGAAIGAAITTGANGQPAPKGLTAQTFASTADGVRAFGSIQYVASGGATTAPTLDNCITALAALHPFYQGSAAWLMSPSAAAALMSEKASTSGQYQWTPDLSAAQPPTLLGKPVYIDPCLPAATTADAYSVFLGDWQRAYTVVRYGRPILVRDEVTVKGHVLLYAEQRVGGNLVDSSAVKAIKTAAT